MLCRWGLARGDLLNASLPPPSGLSLLDLRVFLDDLLLGFRVYGVGFRA